MSTSLRLYSARLRATLTALVLGLAALIVCVPATPANAHDVLLESSIVEGSELDVAPSEWTLRFNNEVLNVGSEAALVGPDGATITLGQPAFDRDRVTFTVPALAKGDYTANWRVVSSDGHPISGSIPFTVTVGESSATSAATTAGSTPPDASSTATTAGSTAPDASSTAPAGDANASQQPNDGTVAGLPMPLAITAAAIGFIVILGAGIAFVMKGRHQDDLPLRTAPESRQAERPASDDTKEN